MLVDGKFPPTLKYLNFTPCMQLNDANIQMFLIILLWDAQNLQMNMQLKSLKDFSSKCEYESKCSCFNLV